MNREIELSEVLEFLRTHIFDEEDCEYIIKLMNDQLELSFQERIRNLEILTAKMDKVLELQYNNYKKVT